MRILLKPAADKTRLPLHTVLGESEPSSGSIYGSSRWKRVLSCSREHALYDVVGLRSEKPQEALDTGTIFHKCLELYYSGLKTTKDTVKAEELVWKAMRPMETATGWEKEWGTVERMVTNYFNTYAQRDRFEVLDVEVTLQTRQDGFPYSARLDTLIVDKAVKGGALWVLEHKSASRIDNDTVDGYSLDLQVLGQYYLVERCYLSKKLPPFMGVMVNIVTKHVSTQFERVRVQPSREMVNQFVLDMKRAEQMRKIAENLKYPRNLASCVRRYGRCQYFEVCRNYPNQNIFDMDSFSLSGYTTPAQRELENKKEGV
jgi:hypothetical protein